MTQSDEAIWPQHCSFLAAVPLDKERFLADLHDERKDFIRAHYLDLALSDEAKWRTYEPIADDLDRLLASLVKLGVHVISKATATDWIEAQHEYKVVVLFAHWRSGLLRPQEVRWNDLFGRVHQPGNDEQRLLSDLIGTDVVPELDRAAAVKTINNALLTQQLCEHAWFGIGPNRVRATPEHIVYVNRRVLDELYPGLLGPATSVEFSDRLVPVEELAGSALSTFTGIFDLSVCNSILLGELIKAQAPGCLVVATRLPANVDYRVVFYRSLFTMLKNGRPYIKTIGRLRDAIRCFWRDEE